MSERGLQLFSGSERRLLCRLDSPARVQSYLDRTPYSPDEIYRSPRLVMSDRKAHCFDGALFAACALRFQGFPPLVVDLKAVDDDDHVICVFRAKHGLGAVSKSNFSGLRYREPVYGNLRELVMSYFEFYFNTARKKTLRAYSGAINLVRYDYLHWMTDNRKLSTIAGALTKAPHYRLLPVQAVRELVPADPVAYRAGLLNADVRGLYQPKKGRN